MQKLIISLKKWPKAIWHSFATYWHHGWWHKVVVSICAIIIVALGTMYGVGQWYIHSQQGKPYVLGTSFIPAYARSLGLNPQQTMDALINDLHVRHFRLVSYWDEMEPTKGTYDFSELDWQFQKAEAAHAKVTLSIGLRQPRWPECHMPDWASNEPAAEWQPQLNSFITAVVNRYKNSPALESYQLENEALLKNFGTCTDFNRSRLVNEFNLVKQDDNRHPIIMSRSNNLPSLSIGQPRPDIIGFSIYRRVWDGTLTHRYLEYPMPSWYYASLAGFEKIFTGRDSVIHELQAEAWPPNGKSITQISLAEQDKSFNAQRLKDTIAFGKATGMHQMDLWGAEYWYYRLTVEHDNSVWNVAKEAFQNQQ
jgi:Beta-galactosidase